MAYEQNNKEYKQEYHGGKQKKESYFISALEKLTCQVAIPARNEYVLSLSKAK